MFAMSIVHAVLFFLLIAAWSITVAAKRAAIARYAPTAAPRKPVTMKRASFLALGALAAVPAAGVVSYLLGTLSANLLYGAGRLPEQFWENLGLVLLVGGVPLVLFIIAREIIFAIGKDHS